MRISILGSFLNCPNVSLGIMQTRLSVLLITGDFELQNIKFQIKINFVILLKTYYMFFTKAFCNHELNQDNFYDFLMEIFTIYWRDPVRL